MPSHEHILKIIDLIRGQEWYFPKTYRKHTEDDPVKGYLNIGIINRIIFQNGDCWRFALLLKTIFPEARAVYACTINHDNHVLIKINDTYYDISGEYPPADILTIFDEDLSEKDLQNFVPFTVGRLHKLMEKIPEELRTKSHRLKTLFGTYTDILEAYRCKGFSDAHQ